MLESCFKTIYERAIKIISASDPTNLALPYVGRDIYYGNSSPLCIYFDIIPGRLYAVYHTHTRIYASALMHCRSIQDHRYLLLLCVCGSSSAPDFGPKAI